MRNTCKSNLLSPLIVILWNMEFKIFRKKPGNDAFQVSFKFSRRGWDQRQTDFNRFSSIETRSCFSCLVSYLHDLIPAVMKRINMNIWVFGTSNQLFIKGFYTETNFQKNKAVTVKTLFFRTCPLFYSIRIYTSLHFLTILLENQFFVFLRFLSFLPALRRILCYLRQLYNICITIICIVGVRNSVLLFSLIRNNL